MTFQKWKLLVWKSLRLRKYHMVLTLLEIVVPVGIAILLGFFFQYFKDFVIKKTPEVILPEISTLNVSKIACLFYTPSNNFTDQLMNNVKTAVGSSELTKKDNETELDTVTGNVTSIGDCYAVIFRNLNSNNTVPDKLKYILRSNNSFHTNELYQLLTESDLVNATDYLVTGFAQLQMAINDEFTKMKTNRSTSSKVVFQAFPFPKLEEKMISFVTVTKYLVIVTVLISSLAFLNDVIDEKTSGVKELMKITGLDEWVILLGWFTHALMLSLIVLTALIVTLKIVTDELSRHAAVFPVIMIATVLYCIANASYCLTFCAIFHKVAVASSIFSLSMLILLFGYLVISEDQLGFWLKILYIFPVIALSEVFTKIEFYDSTNQFSFSFINKSANNGISIPASFGFAMLIFDTFFFLILASYINAINPGKFGLKKSPWFMFESLLPSSIGKEEGFKEEEQVTSKYIQEPPSNLEVTIEITNLYKRFGKLHAVNGVDLNIYNGEITALLGHNGAGKTTTMSMITGSLAPTSGTIYYKNENLFDILPRFREKLGLCPQEDRLMAHLNVMDHLMFFGKLKGMSSSEAHEEATYYLEIMEMTSKESSWITQLSGGMKRKLCLAISLMGAPETLILDEPTSGMDVQSRRKIWDLLLAIRGDRTMILTTHHMEEADALGDRLVIMSHGKVICHGTSLFLKRTFGTGYELTISQYNPDSNSLTPIIQRVIPNATKDREGGGKIVYKLPFNETKKFPELFRNLEASQLRLGIASIGVSYTTMEDVFLKSGNIGLRHLGESTKDKKNFDETYETQPIEGALLIFQQILVLFLKKCLYTLRNLSAFLTRIVIPTAVLLFLAKVSSNVDFSSNPPLVVSLESYPYPAVMVRNSDSNDELYRIYTEFVDDRGGYVIDFKSDPVKEILQLSSENMMQYRKNLIAAFDWNESYSKIMFNPWEYHSLPIAIDTFSNVLLKSITKINAARIETINFPTGETKTSCDTLTDEKLTLSTICVFLLLAYYTIDLTGYSTVFVNMERLNGFKHIQMMSNVSPFVYWLSTLIFDVVFTMVIVMIRLFLMKILDDKFYFFDFDENFHGLLLLLILFAISGTLFAYCLSLLSGSKEGTYSMISIINVVGAAFCVIYQTHGCFRPQPKVAPSEKESQSQTCPVYFTLMKYIMLLIPQSNYAVHFGTFLQFRKMKAKCIFCPDVGQCSKYSFFEYLSLENPFGLLLGFQFLLIDTILYGGLLLLINTETIHLIWNAFIISIFGSETTKTDKGDNDVQMEYQMVQQFKQGAISGELSLLVDGLRKNYVSYFKPNTAVSEASFIIPRGDCFGLLGVSGAGKTTLFKMLTTEVIPTLGDAAVEGFTLSSNKRMYLSLVGYCPQTNCFIDELTGREMLLLIAGLEGYFGNDLTFIVNKWLSLFGLEKHQRNACGNYSGGNKRKLCTAMALAGDPHLIFLDEPTSGVDPVSKHKLYEVLSRSKQSGQSIVLTSHSMEECEAICDRLTIMVAGVMKCIGSPQHLKTLYAQGFSIMIKVKDDPSLGDDLERLKADMANLFSPQHTILKDEHTGLLYYQITNTSLPWSILFENMEIIQQTHGEGLMEEYVLTDSALEEVFMSFADKTDDSIMSNVANDEDESQSMEPEDEIAAADSELSDDKAEEITEEEEH